MRPEETLRGQPIRSLQTMLRVLSEDDNRYPPIVPDGIYNQETLTAVSAFQRINGLPVTGVADQATWETIVAAYELAIIRIGKTQPIEILLEPGQILRLGDQNPYLFLLQPMLIYIARDQPELTSPVLSGILDAPTAQSLREVQKIYGLPVSGELDRNTWRHIVNHFTTRASQEIGADKIYKNK